MSDLDTRLRRALHDLAPQDPTTDGLADSARRYATRTRVEPDVMLEGGTLTCSQLALPSVLRKTPL